MRMLLWNVSVRSRWKPYTTRNRPRRRALQSARNYHIWMLNKADNAIIRRHLNSSACYLLRESANIQKQYLLFESCPQLCDGAVDGNAYPHMKRSLWKIANAWIIVLKLIEYDKVIVYTWNIRWRNLRCK